MRSSFDEGFSFFVVFVFDEVLLETRSEVFGFLFPLRRINIGVARIKDLRINARKGSRDFKVEVRDLLGFGFED